MRGKKIIIISGLLIAISVPLTLSLVRNQTNKNTNASAPNKLEAEGGTPNSLAQTKTDSQASGGSYVALGLNLSNTPSPTPILSSTNPIKGDGWKGSTSLVDYPKTETTTCGSNCHVVDLDVTNASNGNNTTPLSRFNYALNLLNTKDRVLLRNNSNVTVPLASRITRSTKWTSGVSETDRGIIKTYKQYMAFGNQRIKLDASGIGALGTTGALYFNGAANEHWKGFEIIGGQMDESGGSVAGNITTSGSTSIKVEDFWVHGNTGGAAVYSLGSTNTDNTFQDIICWANGAPSGGINTHSGDCFTADFTSIRPHFVRVMAINSKDDGFDLYGADHAKIIDSVNLNSGKYTSGSQSGDGDGYKMWGVTGSIASNTVIGSISIKAFNHGYSWTECGGNYTTLDHNSSINNGGYGFRFCSTRADIFTNNLSYGNVADGISTNNNNWISSDGNPQFADPANGDFSLLSNSPALGSGAGGSNPGASELALQLLKDYWNLK